MDKVLDGEVSRVDLLVGGIYTDTGEILLDSEVEDKAGQDSQPDHHQHDVPEAPTVRRAECGVVRHPEERPGHEEDCNVADDRHGVSDGGEAGPLLLGAGQDGDESEVGDLHAGPPELEEEGEGRVVDELGPLVSLGTVNTRQEDEGEADEDTEETNQVPGLLLAVFPASDHIVTAVLTVIPVGVWLPAQPEVVWSV